MRKTKIRNLAAGTAFLGFLLTLTELHGGPWAGTYIGAALLILGALAALNTRKILFLAGNISRFSADRENRRGRRIKAALKN